MGYPTIYSFCDRLVLLEARCKVTAAAAAMPECSQRQELHDTSATDGQCTPNIKTCF